MSLARIAAGLDALRAADPEFKIFGAGSHRYRLKPVLDVTDFERANGFTLPDEYRAFITELGNGGAGPSYGVMPFQGEDPEDYTKYDQLALPFAYTDDFNPTELLDEDADSDDTHRRYWEAFSQQGMLYICHHGCASREMIVTSGPCKGEVWFDYTAEDAGYGPSLKAGARMGFFDWYLAWIDKSLAERAK